MDVITKEQFDSQRGGIEDTDLVFPIDIQDSTKPDQSPPPPAAAPSKPTSSQVGVEERGREFKQKTERESTASHVKGGSPHRHQSRKGEKRARFYPVLPKKESPVKVRLVVCTMLYIISMCVGFFGAHVSIAVCAI